MSISTAQLKAQQANALLFITDLNSNRYMGKQWSLLVAQINKAMNTAKAQQESQENLNNLLQTALQKTNNFLAEHGYNTTAKEVLTLLKTSFYQSYLKETEPNKNSDHFVQLLLTTIPIYKAWNKLVIEVAQGTKTTTVLNEYLKQNHFNCTWQQVNASFQKMRNHNMNYWAGSYADTTVTLNNVSKPGPVVLIYGQNNISIDQDMPNQLTNKLIYNNGTITWKADLLIKYSGHFTFSEISIPAKAEGYTGPIFNGSLTYVYNDPFNHYKAGDKLLISGQLKSVDNYNLQIPANVNVSLIDHIIKWMTYALQGMMFLRILLSIGNKFNTIKEFDDEADDTYTNKLEYELQQALEAETEVQDLACSPFKTVDFQGNNILKDLQYEKYQAISEEEQTNIEQKIKQQTADEQTYDDAPKQEAELEGDGWGKDLESVFKEL